MSDLQNLSKRALAGYPLYRGFPNAVFAATATSHTEETDTQRTRETKLSMPRIQPGYHMESVSRPLVQNDPKDVEAERPTSSQYDLPLRAGLRKLR